MGLLANLFRQKPKVTIAPLFFKDGEAALAAACAFTPPIREGLLVVGLIDDVENVDGTGPIAMVRHATPSGVQSALAVFPCRDDVLGAMTRIGQLCAVFVGPKPASSPLHVMFVAAILRPEFRPQEGRWAEIAQLSGEKN